MSTVSTEELNDQGRHYQQHQNQQQQNQQSYQQNHNPNQKHQSQNQQHQHQQHPNQHQHQQHQSQPHQRHQQQAQEEQQQPQQFASWERLDFIGGGGQAKVFKARTDSGEFLAAKYLELPPDGGDAAASAAAMEARLLCQLSHRNIVRFVAARPPDPQDLLGYGLVVFTELIEGCTLHRVIGGHPLEEGRIRTYCLQLVDALDYLHTRRPPVIHRDVNCNNVMIRRADETLKLIDFGLSTCLQPRFSDGTTPSQPGSTVNSTASSRHQLGTVGFLAPEILYRREKTGMAQYSAQSDVWAFGCTVYQMATGQAPYSSSHPGAYIYRVVKRGAPRLDKAGSYSEEFRQFYAACVATDRRMRPSAGDLLQFNFLLYRPEELGELRQLKLERQRQCAEWQQQHAKESRQLEERHRRHKAASDAELARERARLAQELEATRKATHKAAGRRQREVAQRARERARLLRRRTGGRGGARTPEGSAVEDDSQAEADETATIERQLEQDLAAAAARYQRDLLAVELRHSEQVERLQTDLVSETMDQQLELDTRLAMLKREEAIALFDKELERHRRDTVAQRAAQLRSHALEQRNWARQLESERATRARQYRKSLTLQAAAAESDFAETAERRAMEFANSTIERERVKQGLERLGQRLAREVDQLNRQAARTEVNLRQELSDRLETLSRRTADRRHRLELDRARRLAETRRAGEAERSLLLQQRQQQEDHCKHAEAADASVTAVSAGAVETVDCPEYSPDGGDGDD